MNHNDYIESLIAKSLAGEASLSEQAELEEWKNASSENLEYYSILCKIFDQAPQSKVELSFDADEAWIRVKQEIDGKKSIPLTTKKENSFYSFIKIAASVIVIVGLGFTIYSLLSSEKISPQTIASDNRVKEFQLPDSTSVVMNKNSKLVYTFSKNKRSAELKGEAYFNLSSDPKRPFELKAGNISIQDIGTSFNVKAVEGSDSIIVYVESGEVILTSASNNYINLIKGEKGVYLRKRDEFIKTLLTDTNALSYKTKIFVFENASLVSAVQKLNEVYESKILLSENLQSCHITATFKNETIDSIIDVIAETMKLKVKKENGTLLLEGESCGD